MNDHLIGNYGPRFAPGVLIDNVEEARKAGGELHVLRLSAWMVLGAKQRAVRVVCGELIEIGSEDGPFVGRCGNPVVLHGDQLGTGCAAHDLGAEHFESCQHGMSKALCSGPQHY